MGKENRKQLNDKNNRKKKVHTKALHSLLMMKTVTLAMQAEHVTNITTPKGKLTETKLYDIEL